MVIYYTEGFLRGYYLINIIRSFTYLYHKIVYMLIGISYHKIIYLLM